MNGDPNGFESDPWVRILRGGVLAALSPDGREGYRVRAWPDLTPETWDPGSGGWRPDFSATEALNEIFKVRLRRDVYDEPCFPDEPLLASVPGGWAIRSDGQELMPFCAEGPNEAEEVADTRKWELLEAFKATLPGEVREVLAEDEFRYVGKTTQGYGRPLGYHKNDVMTRVRDGIRDALREGRPVTVLAKTEGLRATHEGLELNLIEAVEHALIRRLDPAWNRQVQSLA